MSVLENHHWRSAIGCLLESGLADQLTSVRSALEQQIRDLILATDINRQNEFLHKFKVSLIPVCESWGSPKFYTETTCN